MSVRSHLSIEPALRGFVFKRVFNAPRELVFRAWTDPKRLEQWRKTSRISIANDPKGADHGVFQEIVEPERIVFSESVVDGSGHYLFEVLNTVTFDETDGKTTQTLHTLVVEGRVGTESVTLKSGQMAEVTEIRGVSGSLTAGKQSSKLPGHQ